MSPTVLRLEGCEWTIYVHDHLPPHVHVKVGDGFVILNLDESASERKRVGKLKANDIRKARRLTRQYRAFLSDQWKDIHG